MIAQTFALLLITALPLCASTGTGAGLPSWNKYYFDGQEFREGTAAAGRSVYRRAGYVPVLKRGDEQPREDKLPPGTGGLIVLCYIQTAGGKLQDHSGYLPLAGAAVEIREEKRILTIRTDEEGYLALALPAGKYDVRVQGLGLTRKVRIEKGKTALVAIRAGKRMVD